MLAKEGHTPNTAHAEYSNISTRAGKVLIVLMCGRMLAFLSLGL